MKVKVLGDPSRRTSYCIEYQSFRRKTSFRRRTKNVESYELPEENTGFTMGDILGNALKEEVEEKATDDSEK